MGFRAYLKERKNLVKSKYHHLQKKILIKFSSLQTSVSSKFHSEEQKTGDIFEASASKDCLEEALKVTSPEIVSKQTLYERAVEPMKIDSLEKSDAAQISDLSSELLVSSPEKSESGQITDLSPEVPVGSMIAQLIVVSGNIVEKVFVTPRGERISVKPEMRE